MPYLMTSASPERISLEPFERIIGAKYRDVGDTNNQLYIDVFQSNRTAEKIFFYVIRCVSI